MLVVASYVSVFVAGAVVYHFYATKVLGYAKAEVAKVGSKI